MKVELIKDYGNLKKGDISNPPSYVARRLIDKGIVKEIEKKKPGPKPKKKSE